MSLAYVLEGNGCTCNEGEEKSLKDCATEVFRLTCAKGYK